MAAAYRVTLYVTRPDQIRDDFDKILRTAEEQYATIMHDRLERARQASIDGSPWLVVPLDQAKSGPYHTPNIPNIQPATMEYEAIAPDIKGKALAEEGVLSGDAIWHLCAQWTGRLYMHEYDLATVEVRANPSEPLAERRGFSMHTIDNERATATVRAFFDNKFWLMVAAVAAHYGLSNYRVPVDVLKTIIPSLKKRLPQKGLESTAARFEAIVRDVLDANIGVLTTEGDLRITINRSDDSTLFLSYVTAFNGAIRCGYKKPYMAIADEDALSDNEFATRYHFPKDCKLANGIRLPSRLHDTPKPRDKDWKDKVRLCFKTLEYYPAFKPYTGPAPTLIVGAGPTGLYAAYMLACMNKPFILVEKKQRWQPTSKFLGSEALTFLQRTQAIYLNPRWWEPGLVGQNKLDKPLADDRSYLFVDLENKTAFPDSNYPGDVMKTVRTAKQAVIAELDKYTLGLEAPPFIHRASFAATNPKVLSDGFRCIQIWLAQEVLLRMLMDKMEPESPSRIWFNAELSDADNASGTATITHSSRGEHSIKCARIVSCMGSSARDKALKFIDESERATKANLQYVKITARAAGGEPAIDTDTSKSGVRAFVFQPSITDSHIWDSDEHVFQTPDVGVIGDLLTNIRFFPGPTGSIAYVAYVFNQKDLVDKANKEATRTLSAEKTEELEKFAENLQDPTYRAAAKGGHAKLGTEAYDVVNALSRQYRKDLPDDVQSGILTCSHLTWDPGMKLQRRTQSAFNNGKAVFLGDACAQPNFFTGTGLASGWSMVDSFAVAVGALENAPGSKADFFAEHNDRVKAFVGNPEEPQNSQLYGPSNLLFTEWVRSQNRGAAAAAAK